MIVMICEYQEVIRLEFETNRQNLHVGSPAYGPVKLPRQDDFRNFCPSEETEKLYQKLEEVIRIF